MSRPGPHLDDERLSDLVDGGGSESDVRHVELCAECRSRLDAWHEAVGAVGMPPSISEARRAAAVEAALAAVPESDDVPARDNKKILDLEGRRRRGRRVTTVRVAAAAAAVAAIAGVSAAVANGGGNPSHHTVTASPTTYQTGAGQSGGASSAAPAPFAPAATITDIGRIDSTAQLVTALLAAATTGTSLGAAASGTGASGGVEATPQRTSSCPATSVAGGTLVTEATLVWKGTPAVAFVYTTPHGHVALVSADAGCRLLATVPY